MSAGTSAVETAAVHHDADLAATARHIIAIRRQRDALFGDDLFADPAWDMLLDLFVAATEGRRISVSSLCIAAAVPPTTALRHIASLCERGLLRRDRDERDLRKFYLSLATETHAHMCRVLSLACGARPVLASCDPPWLGRNFTLPTQTGETL